MFGVLWGGPGTVIFQVAGLVLAVIGAASSIWYLKERLFPFRRLSWRRAERAARHIAMEAALQGFNPTLIVGIGRGGAVMGALISGCLRHRPLLVVDRKYTWVSGRRTDDLLFEVRPPQELMERVLLVAGEAHTGNTMRLYHDYFLNAGARDLRRAVFCVDAGCTEPIEFAVRRGGKTLLLPWMFAREYERGSLSQQHSDWVGRSASDEKTTK